MGLTLVVHPGVRLTIQAPTVSLARTEASALERPTRARLVLGSIDFQVTTWLEQPLDGTVVSSTQSESHKFSASCLDERGVVWVGDQGVFLLGNNEVTYTATSVFVSASKQQHVAIPVSSSKEPSFHKPDPAPSSTAADSNDGDGDKNVQAGDAVPTSTVTSSVNSPSESTSSDRAKAKRKKRRLCS
ncbi:unnamed protein product [Ectocarpus sp. 6 AP-2014]